VSVGGRELDLYGRDFISLLTCITATSVNITLDKLTFTGRKAPPVYVNDVNKDIRIPTGLRISDVNSQLLFHLPNQAITNNISPNMITIPYGTDLTDLETRLSESLTIEDVYAANSYVGISRIHTLQTGYTNFPGEKDHTTFFEYYKVMGYLTDISNFGLFVKAAESVSI
jgi:hypothetical protein